MAMKMLEAMGIKPEELLTREAQTYPHRSYVSSVESNGHDLDILTEALRDAVTAKILEKKQSHTSNTRSFSIVEAPEN